MSRPTQDTRQLSEISDTGLSPPMVMLPNMFPYKKSVHNAVLQPQRARAMVWAIVRSLAATSTISVDFSSSRYLDVSVPSVNSTLTIYSSESN